jgi:lipopolysaccharide/colanic/teichoic acid biosynthesis glycosyltransferase
MSAKQLVAPRPASLIGSDGAARTTERSGRTQVVPVRPRHVWYTPCKLVIDWLLALGMFIVALPILLAAAVAIRFGSPGPIFYCQTRVGRGGRSFRVIKLRTMVHNAERGTGAVWTRVNDPRITPVGHFLRETHIDEFPQLINVLLGQMSLIGPRPERPEFVESLELTLPGYRERLNLRPGITGLAQLNLPPDTNLESVRQKLLHDLYYVREVSPWLDLRILGGTTVLLARAVLAGTRMILSVPSRDKVQRQVEQIVGRDSDLLIEIPEAPTASAASSTN